jgi:hypothetical protein
MRSAKGQFVKGHPAWPGIDAGRARKALNADTIREMHEAFRRGGRKAIDKVMKQSPAIFLKLLVLLVPRDIEVTHKGGVKAMTDEQIERAIEAIEDMLARRDSGEHAKVIDDQVLPEAAADDGKHSPTKLLGDGSTS